MNILTVITHAHTAAADSAAIADSIAAADSAAAAKPALTDIISTGVGTAVSDTISNSVNELAQEIRNTSLDDLLSHFVGNMVDFAINLGIAILVFCVGRFIINKLYGFVARVLLRRNVDRSLSTFVLSLIKMVLYFILIVTVIGILGIETSSFIAIFASAGVALGMALSGTLQNFAGGVLILLLKPYKVGDFIEAEGFAGTVTEIQIFHTIICTPDNKSIIIPNGGLSTGSINNWSREQYRRVDWDVSISYGNDVAVARKAILAIIDSDERVVKQYIEEESPADGNLKGIKPRIDCSPTVALKELGDSSVNLTVRAWTRSSDYWGVYFEILERIYAELPASGVSFPFPQLDVHVKEQ